MNTPKISVIIPVHNTEPYVYEAVKSILDQTLQELEIIIINDGSTDNSLKVLERLKASDSRIQLYTQTNQGVSMSRNNGLAHATGEFIYFMDSDDLLKPTALEECFQKCAEKNLDFVFFDAEIIKSENRDLGLSYFHHPLPDHEIARGIDWLNFQLATSTFHIPVWLNFIRHSYLEKLNLRFYPGIIHEDQLFTTILYLNADRIGYIPQTFFKRRIRENSIMYRKFSWTNITGYLTTVDEILKYKENKSAEIQKTIDQYLTSMLNAVVWKSHTLAFNDKIRLFNQCRRNSYLKYINFKNLLILFLKN